MPHCIVEYSQDLSEQIAISEVLAKAFDLLKNSGEFEPAAIKLRAFAYQDVLSGLDDHSFVHLRLHILSGRSAEQKLALTTGLVEGLAADLPMVKSLSAEVLDIQRESYVKRIT
ncbi:5-carboxymethyl-2-hydroxymuconate Delta-isomerase [Agarivorans sp. Alg241-V36]|uniref:5-carboxymethyl-2-hydroxymuconate Delta-isomerase n=1 Tax=Agarivorans sp. Alg241-V36 TaxID=2305992 RepID=UPI0013D2A2DF|nr:5-carboxymethyl-2-hydroxymuconate isomerase [Agarivorans sp. Alg241-V36]